MKIIIIGCGKVGLTLAELLSAEKHDVVLIDESSQKLSSIPEELDALRILGNGASVSASIGGKCVDTSMGLTPLEGLIMGTRSGDVDPAVVQYICNKENKTVDEVLNILNKKSGVLGISGVSSDFRDVTKAENEGNERAKAANEAFIYRVIKYIGAYVAAMNGVDAIAFTAGVGENDVNAREKILSGLTYLGIEVDHEANKKRGENTMISTPASKVKVCVIPTNEELAICRETVALV